MISLNTRSLSAAGLGAEFHDKFRGAMGGVIEVNAFVSLTLIIIMI